MKVPVLMSPTQYRRLRSRMHVTIGVRVAFTTIVSAGPDTRLSSNRVLRHVRHRPPLTRNRRSRLVSVRSLLKQSWVRC